MKILSFEFVAFISVPFLFSKVIVIAIVIVKVIVIVIESREK